MMTTTTMSKVNSLTQTWTDWNPTRLVYFRTPSFFFFLAVSPLPRIQLFPNHAMDDKLRKLEGQLRELETLKLTQSERLQRAKDLQTQHNLLKAQVGKRKIPAPAGPSEDPTTHRDEPAVNRSTSRRMRAAVRAANDEYLDQMSHRLQLFVYIGLPLFAIVAAIVAYSGILTRNQSSPLSPLLYLASSFNFTYRF